MGAYMTDEITIIRYAGIDEVNEPETTENVIVKGKIDFKTRMVRDLSGAEVVSSAKIYLPGTIDAKMNRDLKHQDILKFDDVEHAIISIYTPKAFSSFFVFKYEIFVR